MDKVSQALLDKLIAWKAVGERVVDVKSDRREGSNWKVWIYDYEVQNGLYLREEDIDKDWDTLILSDKRRRLAQEIHDLDKRIGGVA